MNTEQVVQMIACKCFFCQQSKPHRESHTSFGDTTSLLLKAESLDPNDTVKLEACNTCGHTRVKEN